jgi:hypothetical protein
MRTYFLGNEKKMLIRSKAGLRGMQLISVTFAILPLKGDDGIIAM